MILRILIFLIFNFSLNAQYSIIKEFNTTTDNTYGGMPSGDVFYDNGWLFAATNNSLVKFKQDGTQFQKVTSFFTARRSNIIKLDSFFYYISNLSTLNKLNKFTKVNTVVYTFDDYTNKTGSNSMGYLAFDGEFFYITMSSGGVYYGGTLVKIKPNGTGYQKLHDFKSETGKNPYGGVIIDSGLLYGMTVSGASIAGGVIYKIKTDGANFDTLKSFRFSEGTNPEGNLLIYNNELYGMTRTGGPTMGGSGTVFKIDKNGQNFEILHSFNNPDSLDGTDPMADLILYGNKFYGLTYAGGKGGFMGTIAGTLFSLNTNGTSFKVLSTTLNPCSSQASLFRINDEFFGTLSDGINTAKDGGIFKFKLNCQTTGTENIEIKNGDTFHINNKALYIPGTYTENLVNAAGCDSVLNIKLSKCTVYKAINVERKQGDTIVWNQKKYFVAGNYFDTSSINGSCDSIFELKLSFCKDTLKSKVFELKSGDSIKLGNKYYKYTGLYYDTSYVGQCKEINEYTISVCSDIIIKKYSTIYYGSTLTVGKNIYAKSGIYYDTFFGSNRCDTIIITDLKVIKKCNDVKVVLIKTINHGDTIKVGKNAYTVSGNFIDTIVTSFGCDSVILTYIVLNPNLSTIYNNLNNNLYFSYNSNLNQIYISNNLSNNLLIKFIDINGKVILERKIYNSEDFLDLSFLSKGIYFVEINYNNFQLVKFEKIRIQ